MICDNLSAIKQNIQNICAKVERNPDEVILVGVSKYTTVDRMKEALQNGVTHLGENRVVDGVEKFEALGDEGLNVTKHLIGHLQTNKAKKAIEVFDLIESVDSIKLLTELEKQAKNIQKEVNVLMMKEYGSLLFENIIDNPLKFNTTDPKKVLVSFGEVKEGKITVKSSSR